MRDDPRLAPSSSLSRCLLGLVALLAVATGSIVRIGTALADPAFDARDPRGMLRSDPGLLYYVTERVVEARGGLPDDWRADPRVEHPDRFDVPASLTVGQEFLVAWTDLLTGERFPLHVVATWVMGIVASLTAVGVLGLAWELSRSLAWSALAVALYVMIPASYRTIGFVLVNEDLSLPLLIAHLWLLARAARVRTGLAFVLAGIALGASLATWHATSFFVTLEAAVFLGLYLVTNSNPFAARRSESLVLSVVPGTLVPALLVKHTLFSPPFAMGLALLAGHRARRHFGGEKGRAMTLACIVVWLAVGAVLTQASGTGFSDFAHVWGVIVAKLAHLGRFPDDPSTLSFEARLLWQGPFATMTALTAIAVLQLVLIAGVPAAVLFLFARKRMATTWPGTVLALLALGSILGAWLVERAAVFACPLLAVLAALLFQRLACMRRGRLDRELAHTGASAAPGGGERSLGLLAARIAPLALVVALAGQVFAFADWHADLRRDGLAWYRPRARIAATREALEAVERHVPAGEAVAADFMLSTAILAHTRRPIVIQPKWESTASRARVEDFWNAFYHGTPEDLRRLLLERWQCSWLLVDHSMLDELRASRRLAGLADSEPLVPGSAVELLLAAPSSRQTPDGFTRVWTSAGQDPGAALVFTLWNLDSR